jgi:hypothetical protein
MFYTTHATGDRFICSLLTQAGRSNAPPKDFASLITAVASGLALKVFVVVPTAKLCLPVCLRFQPCAVSVSLAVVDWPKPLVGKFLSANFIVANVIPVRAAVTGFLAVKIRFIVPAAEPLLESWFSGKPRAVLEAVLVVVDKEGGVRIILAGGSRRRRSYGKATGGKLGADTGGELRGVTGGELGVGGGGVLLLPHTVSWFDCGFRKSAHLYLI